MLKHVHSIVAAIAPRFRSRAFLNWKTSLSVISCMFFAGNGRVGVGCLRSTVCSGSGPGWMSSSPVIATPDEKLSTIHCPTAGTDKTSSEGKGTDVEIENDLYVVWSRFRDSGFHARVSQSTS